MPDIDVYIEHWGYDDEDYVKRQKYKMSEYKKAGITLINTYETPDMFDVTNTLDIKLNQYYKGK